MVNSILAEVERYLNGLIGARDLEAWLVARLQSILDSGQREAIEAANQIDADFIELSEGLLDETGLYARLQALLLISQTITSPLGAFPREERDGPSSSNETLLFTIRIEPPGATTTLRVAHSFVQAAAGR